MDKKSIIGLVLIGVILFGFSWYGSVQERKIREQKALIDSINRTEIAKTAEAVQEQNEALDRQDSTRREVFEARLAASLGEHLYKARQGTEEFLTVENELMALTFSNKGGRVATVELKNYKTYDGKPLLLFDKETSKFDLSFFTNQQIQTSDYYFTPLKVVSGGEKGEDRIVSYRLYADSLSYIEYVYTIRPKNYQVGFTVNLVGMDYLINRSQTDLGIVWENVSPQQEQGFDYENNYTTIAYMYPGESKAEELSFSKGTREEEVNAKLRWVAFKQQFFSSILLADKDFQNGKLEFQTMQPGSGNLKKFIANLSVPYNPQTKQYDFSFYFGPNSYTILRKYHEGFQSLIPLGWGIFGWINKIIIIPTFNFLGKFIHNYGIIILLLTIFIKLIIFPFTYKSYLSMAKMRLLKPELDKINGKYPKKEDAMKKQQAVMDLYRKAGVSPMGGCLPMLFQLPILIAMFRFFPASIELRQEHFLWATDLSSYDSILHLPFTIPFYGDHVSLFALLMGVSMFVSSKLNLSQTAASSNQMPGMTFMTLYIMPVLLVVWFNNYSSGLSYYYFLSNLITIGQMYAFRRYVDDKKLHEKMQLNAKKPRKKSKFQQRYEEMVRQQQEMARKQQGGKR